MAITSLDGYIASSKQIIPWVKTAARTTVAAGWFSVFDIAGLPGAGVLAGTSTTAGVVPTDATAGFPPINTFGSGNTGYISRIEFGSSVACRLALYELLFKAGAFAYNAAQALTGQPSYASRLPVVNGVTDYTGLEIWAETVTAFTGNQTWNVTYKNQDGVSGKTTGAVGISAAPTLGRMWRLPLAAGDSGVQTIENVTGGTGTAGTANILVLRSLWTGRVRIANDGDLHGFDRTGMPQVFDSSALFPIICADGTTSGVPELNIEICNG